MRCLSCGAKAPTGASICAQCGHKLPRFGLMWRRCGRCGHSMPLSRRVCAACGEPLALARTRLWLAVPLATGLLVALAVGLGSAYRRLEASYRTAWPTALHEIALADRATVTLSPFTPTATQSPTVTPSVVRVGSATPASAAPVQPAASNTPLPMATVTATSSATPTPQATVTAPPTATATRSSTPTTAPVASVATVSPEPRYPAPVLQSPANGAVFTGGSTEIWLRWEPVGPLAADEFYAVSLRYLKDGVLVFAGTWYEGTEWLVPKDLWQRYDQGHPEYYWDVTVMRQTGTRPDGGRTGEPVGAVSEERIFIWR